MSSEDKIPLLTDDDISNVQQKPDLSSNEQVNTSSENSKTSFIYQQIKKKEKGVEAKSN